MHLHFTFTIVVSKSLAFLGLGEEGALRMGVDGGPAETSSLNFGQKLPAPPQNRKFEL